MQASPSLPSCDGSTLHEVVSDLEKQDPQAADEIHSNGHNLVMAIARSVKSASSSIGGWFYRDLPTHSATKIRSLSKFPRGYPNLAAFHDSSENFMIYRRFGYLQARVLLEKQDKLRLLEESLDAFDEDNVGCSSSRQPNDMNKAAMAARGTLLGEIDTALSSYTQSLAGAQQLMAFHKPGDDEQISVTNYLTRYKPVKTHEREYAQHKEDLVTLRPGREHAWLDRTIEKTLQAMQTRLPFVHRLFCSKDTKQKNGNLPKFDGVWYYTRSRIDGCAIGLITLTILALLIVPIWLLYHLVADSNGALSGRGNAICIGTLLISTLSFSAVLSLFTRAKRHEILAAAAAYCAVLVVFLGNVRA